MRCSSLLLACFVANASADDSSAISSGVALIQKPAVQYGLVNLLDEPASLVSRRSDPVSKELVSLAELSPGAFVKSNFGEQEAINLVLVGEWSRWTPRKNTHKRLQGVHQGVHTFVSSVVIFDWCLFASAIVVFFVLHMLILGRLSAKGWHLTTLMIWFAVGAAYNSVIWYRFGRNAGISWFAGYLLEFIFLVENIFIFNIVIEAFKVPLKMTTKALHIVVWAQIMFEMVFFMGLAAWLRSFKVLPYILGVWLICCGFLAARGEPTLEGDIMETRVCRLLTRLLGDRLSTKYEKDGKCLLRDDSGRMRVSLLGLVVFVLLLADFLLEIDVVLTKIEELPNHYIAFTSSAVAAFSMPDLFFVSKGLLRHCAMLKYGIGFVLILFGAQMLLSGIYILRPIVACGIVVGVLVVCIIVSAFVPRCYPGWPQNANCGHAAASLPEASSANKQCSALPQLGTSPLDASKMAEGSPDSMTTNGDLQALRS